MEELGLEYKCISAFNNGDGSLEVEPRAGRCSVEATAGKGRKEGSLNFNCALIVKESDLLFGNFS